jgi:hypothetical protein
MEDTQKQHETHPSALPSLVWMTLHNDSPTQTRWHEPHSTDVFTSGDLKSMAPGSVSTRLPDFRFTFKTWQFVPEDKKMI